MGKKHSISKVMLVFAWLMLCVNSVFAAWDGKEMVQPSCNDNKSCKDKVCIIDSEAKLAWYAKTGNPNNYAICHAKLTADLDLGGKLWIPIAAGTGNTLYSKTFDGNGHIIKNLYINGDELHKIDKSYTQNIGFVAALGENGTIKNLVLENVNIQASTSTGDVLSNTATENHQISVGAFVGWMADKKKEVVEKCMVSGIISTTGKGQGVGGIVGNAKQGTISNCLSLVEIRTSGSDAYVGGIIGLIKTDVTVASCVYAGPGLLNLGINNGGSVGGIAGNVYSGNLTVQDDFYEGEDNLQLYGAKCFGNFNDKGECKSSPSVKDASSVDVDGNVGRVRISNQDSVACHLNGTNDDKTCKTEPWAVGETNLSLFGYGTDGYMIVFYANGGKYADGSVAKNKFFDAGMAINADDIVPPSDEERTFVGWALTRDATAPVENLGTVSKSDTVFAVWQPKLTVTFNVSPGVFPDENVDVKTKKVDKGGLVTVGGLGTLPTSYCGQDSAGSCTQWMYFTGWAHKEKPGINDTIHLDTLKANKDYLTLYAVWTAIKTYTVIYNANGHGKTRVDYVHVGENEKLTQPQDPIAHDGYVFETWFTTSSCEKGSEFHFDTEITKSITLYAKWTPESYNITYKSVGDDGLVKDFGGEGGPVNSPDNPIKYNIESETINLMAPTPAEGKVFDGWFNDATFSKKVTRIAKGSFGDRTFYAKWSTKTYRIAYLADNDSYGAVSDQFKVHGESINLETDGHFRRPGYDKQLGWTNTQNGSVDYEFGAVYTVDAPLILYPAWSEPIVYTITYVCAGCENDPSNPVSYTVNTAKELKSPSKIPQGYKFGGWFTDKKYSKKISKIEKGTTGELTLYGKLNKIYNITYVGTNTPNNPKTYTVDDNTIKLKAPASREHYTFVGWFDKDSEDGQQVTEIAKGSSGDKTLYARWAAVEYKITYTTNDGTLPDGVENPQIYTIESEDITLPTPSRNGYDFLGWFGEDGKQAEVIEKGTTGDSALFAKWSEPIEYTIAYNNIEGATNENPVTYTVESGDITLSAPTKNGYDFVGWYGNGEFNGDAITGIAKGTTGDTTLFAKWNGPIEYTIIYNNVEGATNENPVTYTVESETIQLANAVKNGYKFEGWFDKDDEEVTQIAKGSTGDTTLYAKWTAEVYSITYNANEGTLPDDAANPQTYTVEHAVTLPIPTKNGYDFIGWYDGENKKVTEIANGSTGDIELTAKWSEPIKYTITYELNGGTLPEGEAIPETYTVESGDITLPVPTKNGYDFVGWYDGENNKIEKIANGSTGDIELTAKWSEPIKYTITVNVNCGTLPEGAAIPGTYTVESDITLPIPTKNGYTFEGWYGNGEFNGDAITGIAKGTTGDTTLFAKWSDPVKYEITYELNGGELPEGVSNPAEYTVESAVTLPEPTKNGYDFVGWYDKENNKIEKIANGSTGDIELTAKWSEPIKYTITVNVNGGTLPEGAAIPETYTVESENVDFPIPTKNGYTFAGWYDGENKKVTEIANGSTGDIELTAKWSEPIKYTITVNVNGGTLPDDAANPQTYTVEHAVTLPVPTKNGYTFEGWYDQENNKIEKIAEGSTGDVELTAKWNGPVEYSITVDANGGTLPEGAAIPGTYTVESDISLPIPTREGYNFVGWFDKENKKIEKIVNGSTGDIELTAKWEIIVYTISYVAGGEGVDGENTSDKKEYGTPVRLKGEGVFTREGYVQDGWALSEDGEKVYALGAYYRADEDVALYPHWVQGLVVEHYGAVTIYRYPDEKVTAVCDGEYTGTDVVNITNNIKVDEITFIRNFNVGVSSTVVLPFSINLDNIKGGSFYRFNSILKKNDSKSVGFSTIGDSKLYANTPYLFIPNESELVFKGGAVFNTSVKPFKEYIENDSWKFNGTYEYMNFDNHLEHGYIWGFVGQQHVGFKVGAFVKAGTNVTIKPFRAYLIQPRDPQLAKSSGSLLDYLGSLDEIDVVIVDDDDNVIESGKMNIVTGKIRMDRWYDLKGRVLNSKPTARGTYYHKGKRVIIK